MVAALNGVIFHQFYGDNSGGTELDIDGDGTPTQEDEFVSIMNTTGAPVDISGWEIWSDMSGAGAPDGPQDGIYHTFPPGTILAPGQVLYIINEYTGTLPGNFQEASEGGLESGAGGTNTNFLSEGDISGPESLALVDPITGDYIVFNMSDGIASDVSSISGFSGTTEVAESNAATDSGVGDQNAGSAYLYNAMTDSYDYTTTTITCFGAGTLIATVMGEVPVEELRPGDLVMTRDHGPQMLQLVLRRHLNFDAGDHQCHKPIAFHPGSLGNGLPQRRLRVSPQHRMLIHDADGTEVLAPAKGLLGRPRVRVMAGCKKITYIHLVFSRHEVINAEGCWCESFYPGEQSLSDLPSATKRAIDALFPTLCLGQMPPPARPFLRVKEAARNC